jgi:hypothetical protein
MLTINAPVFDLAGSETIASPKVSGLSAFGRRVTRTPTLDGSAAINDFGYSDADRTLSINWTPRDRAQTENVARMVKTYGRLIVSCREGCFLGAPESFNTGDDGTQIRILVERKISA